MGFLYGKPSSRILCQIQVRHSIAICCPMGPPVTEKVGIMSCQGIATRMYLSAWRSKTIADRNIARCDCDARRPISSQLQKTKRNKKAAESYFFSISSFLLSMNGSIYVELLFFLRVIRTNVT